MATLKGHLATESHPASDHHWEFAAICLDKLTGQLKGLPVTINFSGEPVGTVTDAERTDDGILLTMEVTDTVTFGVASPAFVAHDADWDSTYTDRVIHNASIKQIGLTDD
jgi:hypothetical protein